MYKVVKKINGEFCSLMVQKDYDPDLFLTYKVGETTYPADGTGGIFVFEKLKDAKLWATGDDEFIFECEVAEPVKLEYFYFLDYCWNFWRDYKAGKIDQDTVCYYTTESVYLAKSVKLLREINKWEC